MEEDWKILFTPDAILDLSGATIVELKGYNSREFARLMSGSKLPQDAINQAQMYMWLTGIHKAIIIVECKDTQEFAVWPIAYDPALTVKYEKRLNFIQALVAIHAADGRLPDRICMSEKEPTAKGCRMCKACFSDPVKRETL